MSSTFPVLWNTCFLLQLMYLIVSALPMLLPANRAAPFRQVVQKRIGSLFGIANLLGAAWVISFMRGHFFLCSGIMLALFAVAARMYFNAPAAYGEPFLSTQSPSRGMGFLVTRLFCSVFFSWISVSTICDLSASWLRATQGMPDLQHLNWTNEQWGAVLLFSVLAISTLISTGRKDFFMNLVMCFSSYGVFLKHVHDFDSTIASSAMFVCIASFFLAVINIARVLISKAPAYATFLPKKQMPSVSEIPSTA